MANLGFVGLGAMGGRITKRLLSKGHCVTGYDLFPEKAQELAGIGL
ncbi:MAG: NAD(P)-binding domain-containing protein, partial [Acidobacteria bacterium]|nr:NAD(P)-binding domain-containing protein [Acidobacteriota bacterium]